MYKRILALLILLAVGLGLLAQSRYTGTISDERSNEPLAGAYIRIPGTQTVAVSDMLGRFLIESSEKIDSLTISYVGYKTRTIAPYADNMQVKLEQKNFELDQVVVSASKEYQSRQDIPIAVTVLPSKTIEDTKPVELSELLNKVSGVHVANFGNENQSASIRQPLNFSRTQLVLLEDEIPIMPTTIGTSQDLKNVNMAVVKGIEVLRGPASSIYGSEAIGGTMNFITKNPPLRPHGKLGVQGTDMGYRRLDFEAGNTFNRLGLFIGGYIAQNHDSYRDYSDFEKTSVFAKGIYRLSEKAKVTGAVNYSDNYSQLGGSLDSAIYFTNDRFNQYAFTYLDIQNWRASLRFDQQWRENDKTFLTLHFKDYFEDEIPTYYIRRIYGGPPPAKYKGEYLEHNFNSYGFVLQHSHRFPFMDARLIAGISADYTPFDYVSKVINVTREGELYTGYTLTDEFVQNFHADLFNSAEYLQFEFSPLKKLKVSTAIRYDRLDYDYDNKLPSTAISGAPDEKNTFDHFSPKIGLNYNVAENLGLYTGYSVGFAPPLFAHLYKAVIVPVLKPSSYNNFEIGGWLGFLRNNGYIDVSLYQSNGKNETVSVLLDDGSTQNQSTGETSHRGIEYMLKYNYTEQLNFRLSGALSEHKFVKFSDRGKDFSGKFMSLAPKTTLNMELTYSPNFLRNLRLSGELQRIGKYFVDDMNTREYPGYQILNMRAGYNYRGIDFWVNVLNLTDEKHSVRVQKSSYSGDISYMPGIRRTILLGIALNLRTKDNPR